MCDKLFRLLQKHDRYKFPKSNMSRTVKDIFPVDPNTLFKPQNVENIVQEILELEVDDSFTYNAEECRKLCIILADKMRKNVKELNYDRYKFVCLVQIFEKKNQGLSSIVRLLCDTNRDRYAIVKKEYKNVFIISSIYGLHYP